VNELIIHDPVLKGRRLTSNLSVSEGLEKYIKEKELFIEYDTDIYANTSILNIPLISAVLPLAWLSGSDIQVNSLDKRFKESMEELKLIFKKMYPLIPFTTEINVDEIVENEIEILDPDMRTGLLFSGGVDATYSFIMNLNLKPRLVMHWGVERTPYPVYSDYWEKVRTIYRNFSERHGVEYYLTQTNPLEILHERMIEHDFYKELAYGSLWVKLQHSLILLSLAAPLSVKRFDQLLISSAHHPQHTWTLDTYRPDALEPETDEKISWSTLNVKQTGYIPRYQKTKVIADYLKNENLILRVCLERERSPKELNCSNCKKCFRTIAQLVQFEIDPNQIGFKVDESTFEKMRTQYAPYEVDTYVSDIKNMIPENIEFDLYGSKDFFTWFRGSTGRVEKDVWLYRDVYVSLPYPIAKVLDKLYRIVGINIHEHSPVMPEKRLSKLMFSED
jgi:hypothetical protein